LETLGDPFLLLPGGLALIWLFICWLTWKTVLERHQSDPNDPLTHPGGWCRPDAPRRPIGRDSRWRPPVMVAGRPARARLLLMGEPAALIDPFSDATLVGCPVLDPAGGSSA